MLAQTVFWAVLSAGFLALAVTAFRRRRLVIEKTNPPNVFLAVGGIGTHEGAALAHIMLVETIGFALAAAAAFYSALA